MNDGETGGAEKQRQTQLPTATHSELAAKKLLCKSELSRTMLRCFHRPRLSGVGKMSGRKCCFHLEPFPNPPHTNTSETIVQIQNKAKLVMNGTLVLCEYIEENPPMLSNVGMASKVNESSREGKASKGERTLNL